MQAAAHPTQDRPEPTLEQLALAYRNMRRPGMPDDLAEALLRPNLAACIRGAAFNLRRLPPCAGNKPPRIGAMHWAPPTPTQPPSRQKTPGSGQPMDCKRAAANDYDD